MIIRTFGKKYHCNLKIEADVPEKARAKFIYQTPSLKAILEAQDTTSMETTGLSKEEAVTKLSVEIDKKADFEMVRTCLVAIENLKDDSGTDLVWPMDKPGQDEILAALAPHVAELASIFEKAVVVTEDERKNSK